AALPANGGAASCPISFCVGLRMYRRLRLPQCRRESIRKCAAYLFARRSLATALVGKPHAGSLADRDCDGKSSCCVERPGRNCSSCRNELEHFTQSVSE